MAQSSNVPLDENARLMRRVADDDVEAFGRLHLRYAPILRDLLVRRGATRISADDFVQKIFSGLWEKRKSFRGESSFETYLFSMARHTLDKEIRQSHKIADFDTKQHTDSVVDSHTGLSQPEAELYLQELMAALEVAKAKLTPKQRQALEVSQDGNVPLDKGFEEIGLSHGALKNRLKRARKRLKELLAPFLSDDKPSDRC